MLTIYAIPISLYCAKLRILLRHKNITWQETLPPGGYGSEEYKQVISSGNLPAMVDGELILADSEAIAEYLNEKYPEPEMLPGDMASRAKARELSRFHDTRLEPEVRALFAHIKPAARSRDVINFQSEKITHRLNQFSRMLNDRKMKAADDLTLGDCGYQITFLWIDRLTPLLGLSVLWPDNVVRYRKRVGEIPAVAGELDVYTPLLTDWLNPGEKRHET